MNAWLIDNHKAPPTAKVLMTWMAMQNEFELTYSLPELASLLGFRIISIRRAIAYLVESGNLKVDGAASGPHARTYSMVETPFEESGS